MAIRTIQLAFLIEQWGVEKTTQFLQTRFACQRNADVQQFLHTKAIRFEQVNAGRTYLIIGEYGELLAYFSLSFKEIHVKTSKSQFKNLTGGLVQNEKLKVFLIGQIGKNDLTNQSVNQDTIQLQDILTEIFSQIRIAQKAVGGRVVILECENNPKLIAHYERHQFKLIETVHDETDLKTMYIVPKLD